MNFDVVTEDIKEEVALNTDVTIEKIIEYYSHANEHYPISDLFMYRYRQTENGYLDVANGFQGRIVSDDKFFFESELIKEMLDYAPMKYFLKPLQNNECTISQKWHLLISYYLYAELKKDDKEQVWKMEKYLPMDWYFTEDKRSSYKCPELCLWMVEAAKDDNIITVNDVYELFYQAVEFKKKSENKNSKKRELWDNYIWWKKNKQAYWNKVLEVIRKSMF